jgi:hypothetical protein
LVGGEATAMKRENFLLDSHAVSVIIAAE